MSPRGDLVEAELKEKASRHYLEFRVTTGAPCTLRLDYAVFFPSVNVRSLQPNDKVEQAGNYRVCVSAVF